MNRVYVWEFPVRITHWINAISIAILAATGFYIGAPFIYGGENSLIMSTMRFLHSVAGYAFTVSVLVRIYWMFIGNKYARLNQLFPTNKDRIKNAVDTGLYYAFVKKEIPHSTGFNGLEGMYFFVGFCLFVFEILSGFALLKLAYGGGFVFSLFGGWTLAIFSAGTLRMLHHIIAVELIGFFAIVHIYMSWHDDSVLKNGLISSIFSGYKHLDKD